MWSVSLSDNSMWFQSRSCQFNNVVLMNRWMIIFHWGWCCCWWTRCLIWRREISGCAETLKTSYSSSSKPRMETPSTGATDTRAVAFLLSVQSWTCVFASLQENCGSRRLHDLAWASVWFREEIPVMIWCMLTVFCMYVILVCLLTGFLDPCRDSYWPNGILAETPPRRDKSVRMRTRVAAKTTLLGIMPGTHTHTHTSQPESYNTEYTDIYVLSQLGWAIWAKNHIFHIIFFGWFAVCGICISVFCIKPIKRHILCRHHHVGIFYVQKRVKITLHSIIVKLQSKN